MGHEDKSCGSSAFFSFLSGVIFGGAMGLLFAPVPGKDARKTIHEKYDDVKEKLKKLEDKFKKHEEESHPAPDTE